MPVSKRRKGAGKKVAFNTQVNQTFARIAKREVPTWVAANPPINVTDIRNVEEFELRAPELPAFVMWRHDDTFDISINAFRVDEFLNKHAEPGTPLYAAVRKMLMHFCWIGLLGMDAARTYLAQNRGNNHHLIGDDPEQLSKSISPEDALIAAVTEEVPV